MVLPENFQLANRKAKEMQETMPRAESAYYDRRSGRIVVHLSSKLILSFSPEDVQGLENSKPSQLTDIQISPSGFGVHFPKLDADIYVPGLLEGFLGSKKWMAARLGQSGGQSKSRAKRAASRANGKLGGRPRKVSGS